MTELKKSYSIESESKSSEIISASTEANGVHCKSPVVVSYPRIDSKLILQNMEEVLHSVKKQHKEKHRRKKELKKLARIEAGGDSTSNHNGEGMEGHTKQNNADKKIKQRDKDKRHSKKRPLQDKSAVENGKVLQESPVKSGTILQHFQRTPRKDEDDVEVKCNDDVHGDSNENNDTTKTPNKNFKVTNAFEVMMNARNKTIGSNTPGKESPSPVADKCTTEINAKRKLKLQEWAEQKGGAKRKLEEEARAAYVEEQLEQRAKRFKNMLVSGGSPKSLPTKSDEKDQPKKPKERSRKEKSKEKEAKVEKVMKKRTRRLSSFDSVESVEISEPLVDSETADFLSKLSSPTKKRDSLLGYFPKKDSPKELADKQEAEENKKAREITSRGTPRGRYKKVSSGLKTNVTPSTNAILCQEEDANTIETPSGRPRRSCAGKARYDFDLESSPTKTAKAAKSTPVRKCTAQSKTQTNSANDEEYVDIIILDDSTNLSSTSGNITPQGTPKKLAPLFVRSIPKPSPDPEVLKARKAFLQSGVPEKLRLEQEKQKQYEQIYEESIEIFPKIAHITQLSEDDIAKDQEMFSFSFKLRPEERWESSPARKGKSTKRISQIGVLSNCSKSDFLTNARKKPSLNVENISLPSLANKRSVIKCWKTEFERFPTFKCYNQMREKYRYFSAIDSAQDTEQVSESFVVTRRTRRSLELQKKSKEPDNPDDEYKPPAAAPNGELLFSEKYKPLLFEQVLVNLNPVSQLKEFLSNWSNGGSGPGSAKNSQNFDDSMDLNDSSCSNQGPSCNTVVLLGPVSSGKTNAVFALANEMNFNVLEINAGMKRTGKRLIQELLEATQSHQIRKDAAGTGSSQKKNLLKMSLNGLKSQMKRQNSNSNNLDTNGSDSSNGEMSQSTRKCLILIEDADIIFDQTDAGFTDAIYTLAASSKRPVIVVASNPNCNHLQRLMAQNTIHFSSPNVLNISRFLSVLSLMENCPVLLDDIVSLYLYNNRDLRKTLLEMQFFIQSGGDRHKKLKGSKDKADKNKDNTNYFASPRKRQFSVEQEQLENQDNNLPSEKVLSSDKPESIYMHRSLFEFYTVCQNFKFRVPFPVDFQMFGNNLSEIFHVSRKLVANTNADVTELKSSTKRKSKSPKKQWLNNALKPVTPLDNLCSFYENLSIASSMCHTMANFQTISQKCTTYDADYINPNLSENISHTLLENAIEVNLDAEPCPYNLFDTPKVIIPLCNELGTMQNRSKRSRNLDYEPCLRSICRSEKIRSTQERRSTRFYHYLRSYAVNVCNFSTTPFDEVCEVFKVTKVDDGMANTT